MNCPPDVAAILLEILTQGLLQARAAGWAGDAALAAAEVDHVHNLPGLLADYSPGRLRYYWDNERSDYLSHVSTVRTSAFLTLWEKLHSIAEPHIPTSIAG